MPRSRSLVASPDPASFYSCRLLEFVVSCHIGHPNRFLVPSRAPSNLSVYQLCHLVHHRTCLSTNCAISCTIEPVCLPIMPRRASSKLSCSSHRRSDLVLAIPIKLVSTDPATSPPITFVFSDRTHRARPRQYRLCHINLVNVIHDHSSAIPIVRPYHEQCSMPYHVFPSHRPIPIAFARICCHLRPSLVYHQSLSPSHDPIAYSSLIMTPLPACVTLHHHRSSSSPTDYRRSRPIAFAYAIKFSLRLSDSPTQPHYSKYGGRTSSNPDPNNTYDN